MEFANPKVSAFVFDHSWLDERFDLIEGLAERQWSQAQANRLQNDALVAEVHRTAGLTSDYVRAAQGAAVVNDLAADGRPVEFAESQGGSLLGGERRPYVLESDFQKRQRAEVKARKALAAHQAKAKPAAGRQGWSDVLSSGREVVVDLAQKGLDAVPYVLKGRPSRKAMTEAAKVAEAAHARRKAVLEAYPDRATAEAMVRGLVRAESPLHLSLMNYAMAKDLRLPLVDAKWGPGRKEPDGEDVAQMFTFLAAERIEDDLMEQLEVKYADFAERGVLALSSAERRRELAIAEQAIHAAELEEASHMLGLIESEGTLILPPARMSARALLGIA